MVQVLFTAAILNAAAANMRLPAEDRAPVVKIFNPVGSATWLISEIEPDGRCFALCDLGLGTPELGYVNRAELEDYREPRCGMKLQRDKFFIPSHTLIVYAAAARDLGEITEDDSKLEVAAARETMAQRHAG